MELGGCCHSRRWVFFCQRSISMNFFKTYSKASLSYMELSIMRWITVKASWSPYKHLAAALEHFYEVPNIRNHSMS